MSKESVQARGLALKWFAFRYKVPVPNFAHKAPALRRRANTPPHSLKIDQVMDTASGGAQERPLALTFFKDMMRAGTASDPVIIAIDAIHDDAYVLLLKECLSELKDGELHVIFRLIKDDGAADDIKKYDGVALQEISRAIELFATVRKHVVCV